MSTALSWPGVSDDLTTYAGVLDELARDVLAAAATRAQREDEIEAATIATLVGAGAWNIGVSEAAGGVGGGHDAIAITVAHVAAAFPAAALAIADVQVAARAVPESSEFAHRLAAGSMVAILDARSPLVCSLDGRIVSERLENGRCAAAGVILGYDGGSVALPDIWASRMCGESVERSGMRGAPPCQVSLSADAVSGVAATVDELRDLRLLLLGAIGVGLIASGLRHASAYADERHQFGHRLSALTPVRSKLQRTAAVLEERQATLLAACAAPDWVPAFAARTASAAVRSALDMLQVFGGYGYLNDYPAESVVRDAVTLRALVAASLDDRGQFALIAA